MEIGTYNSSNNGRSRSPPRSPSKSQDPPKKDRLWKAKELLRKAIKEGKLEQILWGGTTKQKKRSRLMKENLLKKATESPKEPEESAPINDVALWNSVLIARVLKKTSSLSKNLTLEEEAYQNSQRSKSRVKPRYDSSTDEDDEYDDDEAFITRSIRGSFAKAERKSVRSKSQSSRISSSDELNEESEESSQPETDDEDAVSRRSRRSVRFDDPDDIFDLGERKKHKKKKKRRKSREHAHHKSRSTDTPQANERAVTPSKQLNLKDFDTLPIVTDQESLLTGGQKKPRRVSQIIKETKAAVAATYVHHLDPVMTGDTPSGSEESSSDDSDEDDRFEPDVFWKGAKRRRSAIHPHKHSSSLDVIEKLFNMSDDLRVERESIIEKGVHIDPFHTLTTGNMTENDVRQQGAATLRYSEEIEEVARNKQMARLMAIKAALIRLKKSAARYRSYHTSNLARFAAFWDTLQVYNSHLDATDYYEMMRVISEDAYDQVEKEKPVANLGLESIFAEDLSLLLATKARVHQLKIPAGGVKQALSPTSMAKKIEETQANMMKLFDINTSPVAAINAIPFTPRNSTESTAKTSISHDLKSSLSTISEMIVNKEKHVDKHDNNIISENIKAPKPPVVRATFRSSRSGRSMRASLKSSLPTVSDSDESPTKDEDILDLHEQFKLDLNDDQDYSTFVSPEGTPGFQHEESFTNQLHSSSLSDKKSVLQIHTQNFGSTSNTSKSRKSLLSREEYSQQINENDFPSIKQQIFFQDSELEVEESTAEMILNQFLHYVDLKLFSDVEAIRYQQERQTFSFTTQLGDPTSFLPVIPIVKTEIDPNEGIWKVDPALPENAPPKLLHPPSPVKKQPPKIRNPVKIQPFNRMKEIEFDPATRKLIIDTWTDPFQSQQVALDITSIFLTQSNYLNMITLRTTDTTTIPSGYIGTFSLIQWYAIEEEINFSLIAYENESEDDENIDNNESNKLENSEKKDNEQKNKPKFSNDPIIIPRYTSYNPLELDGGIPKVKTNKVVKEIKRERPQIRHRYKSLLPNIEVIKKLQRPRSAPTKSSEPTQEELNQTTANQPEKPKISESAINLGYQAKGHIARSEQVSFAITGLPPPSDISPYVPTIPKVPVQRSFRAAKAISRVPYVPNPKPKPKPKPVSNITKKAKAKEEEKVEVVPEIKEFSYEDQIILLMESRRLMQFYMTKKFLQMDLPVNIHLTPYDITESILEAPNIYGVILLSYLDLQNLGIEKTLAGLLPPPLNRRKYSIFVYDVPTEDDDDLQLLESCGVADILSPPYSLMNFKAALDLHKQKQDLLFAYKSTS